MLFSSSVFIYLFLPAVVFVYYVLLRKSRMLQNIFLVFASLFFYAWGEPKFVLIMILSIFVNYIFGILVDKFRDSTKSKVIIALTVVFNLGILFIFKYLNFSVSIIEKIANVNLHISEIALPIGISFFTFQAMSYVIDVYRSKGEVQKNILNVALYISFFPQLIAGPIVRYETIANEIKNRKETLENFLDGFVRFVIGLAKKVLLANNFAVVADRIFDYSEAGNDISSPTAWLGAICYTLQIFYDFSGYSDMAIGLGKMFGFHFLENFNYPYISTSITEFWRRWHISLGTWFRDYVYIPLGGSRVKKSRLVFNLFIVWFLTGVWHGAIWTFIVWGLMYFVLLTIEKLTGFYKTDSKAKKVVLWLYSMLFVVLGWVVFRSTSLPNAFNYITKMFNVSAIGIDSYFVDNLKEIILFIGFGILFSVPIIPKLKNKLKDNILIDIIYVVLIISLFILSIASVASNAYNPFIYFNF